MKKTKENKNNTSAKDINSPEIRAKYGYLAAGLSIFVNIALFIIKIILGILINSIGLIADGIHSLSDTFSSIIVIIGFYIYKKPADTNHPLGHGRSEYISTLLLSIILIIAGLLILKESIEKLINFEPLLNQHYLPYIAVIVIFTAFVKEIIARYSEKISKKINSESLKADAWHHRTDAISSIGVAIGIIGSYFGIYFLDSIFGICISFLIIYIGIELIKKSSDKLIGTKPDESTISKLHYIAKECKGLENIHDISIHDYGTIKIATLHATFDRNLSLEKAHYIADCFEEDVKNKLNLLTVVHLEPDNTKPDECKSKQYDVINCLKQFKNKIISFHKIRLFFIEDSLTVKMHLIVDPNMTIEDSHQLYEKIKNCIEKKIGFCDIDIHFDPYNKNINEKK